MKLRISDRIFVAISGILLLSSCAGIVAQMFFNVDLIGLASRIFNSDTLQSRLILIGAALILLLLGLYCLLVMFRHRSRKDRFVLQKNEGGEIAISIKALENMVQKCLDQHEELKIQNIYLENRKDGLLIRLRGISAGGVSIPLTVEALQKQVRQYVTACSGVEIKGIRVQIAASGADATDAPFAIAAPTAKPLLREPDERQIDEPETTGKENPVDDSVVPAAGNKQDIVPVPEEDEDDRPLHQRLFSTKPEPCIVPEPPVDEDNEKNTSAEHEDDEKSEETAEVAGIVDQDPVENDLPEADTEMEIYETSEGGTEDEKSGHFTPLTETDQDVFAEDKEEKPC